MHLLYSLIYVIALGFLLPFEYLKRPKGLRKRWLRERFGEPPASDGGAPCIWVHAVSVGEVLAAVPFIKGLKARHPGLRLVVSTVTDTGQKVARGSLGDIAEAIYLPFDMASVLDNAVSRLNPVMAITIETEIWPNLFRSLRKRGVPVVVLNGRISDSSFRGYRKIRFFIRRVLRDVDVFCMQDETYARRIIELGVEEKKVRITGNFKFDIKVPLDIPGWSARLSQPVIVGGSTHRGEEELLVAAYARLREEFSGLTLILAPRHPERSEEVQHMLRAKGIDFVLRSSLPEGGIAGSVVLLDTVGELASVYGISDVAVVGGSFIEHGGQNPLEPAFWGKPVICGPHMENFPFMEEFYAAGAALSVGREGLQGVLRDLLGSPEKRGAMGRAGRELVMKNRGAVERALGVVEGALKGRNDAF
jgi:3-deoxy-D-manno-octulosonic-acid transferase